MSKRKTDWEELNRNKKARLDKIGSFWKNHYKLNVNDKSKLEASEVYKLFIQLNPGIEIDIDQFKSHKSEEKFIIRIARIIQAASDIFIREGAIL